MHAIVTGGGGFLGSGIVRALLDRGDRVTVVARGDYPALAAAGATVARIDISDKAALERLVTGPDRFDVAFHVAAKTGVWGKEADFVSANVTGTENVLAACRAGGIRRLVHTSSPSVIFDGHDHLEAGNDLPYPTTYMAHYPRTKAASERLVLAANGPDLAITALRPHLIYGPGDPWLLPRVLARHRAGRLRIIGDGTNRVSLTFQPNAVAAHLAAADALTSHLAPCAGRPYFVNDTEPVVLWDWINAVFEGVGLPRIEKRISLGAARTLGSVAEGVWSLFGLAGDPPMTRFVASQMASSHTYAIAPARDAFGFVAPIDGPTALAQTIAWWKDHLPEPG